MRQRLLFRREFRAYYGGHGKVWDYFRHAATHPDWEPRIHLTATSVDAGNPWREACATAIETEWQPDAHHALFLAGMDWQAWPEDRDGMPVINLIQGVRHAQPGQDVHPFLRRRAVRICVSQAVADAIVSTGLVRGPVLAIDAALDLPPLPAVSSRSGIVIGASKQPALGMRLAGLLHEHGLETRLLDAPLPRGDYLTALAGSEIAVLLPHATEGFYLPALEGMALGCAVAVPDCVGNRAYLQPGVNALSPGLEADALCAAVLRMHADPALRERLRAGGIATAARHSQARERAAFHRVLDDLPALWASAA